MGGPRRQEALKLQRQEQKPEPQARTSLERDGEETDRQTDKVGHTEREQGQKVGG